MGASETQRQLNSKRSQRIDAEKKASEHRRKESEARTKAAKARLAADTTSSALTRKSKLSEAEREEKAAAAAGKTAGDWASKAAGYAKAEGQLQEKCDKERAKEEADANRRRLHAQKQAETAQKRAEVAHRAERDSLQRRINQTEYKVSQAIRELRVPKPEKLRILLLGATSDGGLRIGREQKRIRAAVNAAINRDSVELDGRPAATTQDLLDGLSGFRPHVVHFSGHSDEQFIEFEKDIDEAHESAIVTAEAFVLAMKAPDEPPLLVMLNSCNSAKQADQITMLGVAPFAIGMSDEIEDGDAIAYAAQFYAAITDGQSIQGAHNLAVAGLALSGLTGVALPHLATADDVDPAAAFLVKKLA
ncbi:hypothetical protein [Herbidospora sp. RD11066]